MQNALREHSAIPSTFIKLTFVVKTFVLSICEWPLKTGFTVYRYTLGQVPSTAISCSVILCALVNPGFRLVD